MFGFSKYKQTICFLYMSYSCIIFQLLLLFTKYYKTEKNTPFSTIFKATSATYRSLHLNLYLSTLKY